jgi:hypothetical protein
MAVSGCQPDCLTLSIHISTVLEKELDDGSVTMSRCLLQCTALLAASLMACVHICAVLNEERHHRSVTTLRCLAQRFMIPEVHFCAVLQ